MKLLAILNNQMQQLQADGVILLNARTEYTEKQLAKITNQIQDLLIEEVGEKAEITKTRMETSYGESQVKLQLCFGYGNGWTRDLKMVFDPETGKFTNITTNSIETKGEKNLMLMTVALGIIAKHIMLDQGFNLGAVTLTELVTWTANYNETQMKPMHKSIIEVEKLIVTEKQRIETEKQTAYFDSIKNHLKKGCKFVRELNMDSDYIQERAAKVIELTKDANLEKARVHVQCFNQRGYYTDQLDGSRNKSVTTKCFKNELYTHNYQPVIEETPEA